MKRATRQHAQIEAPLEKCPIAVEPSLCLQKSEKEQTRRVQERDLFTVDAVDAPSIGRRRVGESGDAALQLAIEAPTQRVASEHLGPSRVGHHIGFAAVGRCSKREQRLGVAVDDVRAVGNERNDAGRPTIGAGPDCQRHVRAAVANCRDKPEHVRQSGCETRCRALQRFVERGARVQLEEQRPQRSASGGDGGGGDAVGQAQASARGLIEGDWRVDKAKVGNNWNEFGEATGSGESRRGGSERAHADRVRTEGPSTLTGATRLASVQRVTYARPFHSTRRPRSTARTQI